MSTLMAKGKEIAHDKGIVDAGKESHEIPNTWDLKDNVDIGELEKKVGKRFLPVQKNALLPLVMCSPYQSRFTNASSDPNVQELMILDYVFFKSSSKEDMEYSLLLL